MNRFLTIAILLLLPTLTLAQDAENNKLIFLPRDLQLQLNVVPLGFQVKEATDGAMLTASIPVAVGGAIILARTIKRDGKDYSLYGVAATALFREYNTENGGVKFDPAMVLGIVGFDNLIHIGLMYDYGHLDKKEDGSEISPWSLLVSLNIVPLIKD